MNMKCGNVANAKMASTPISTSNWKLATLGLAILATFAHSSTVALAKADQAQSTGEWVKLGEFDLEPGATLTIIPAKSKGHIAADGFALIPVTNK